ncbi:MAG: hypothetical protein QHI48_00835 [Bacteroidota bacterium]|nr:hypothetical protein [Bacteroidota bacterium]
MTAIAGLFAAQAEAQLVIRDLSYEITIYGDVILRWMPPEGVDISQTNIYRGTSPIDLKLIAELHSRSVREYTDHSSNVIPGNTYIYWVRVIDNQGNWGDEWIRVLVTPPPTGMKFTSVPPTTGFVGIDYWYSPITVDAAKPEDVEYTFGGPHPDGMELNSVGGGIYTFIYWHPVQAGQYRITLIATHKKTRAIAVQEFTITVASQAGHVRGAVKAVDGQPLPNTVVRIFQIQNHMAYETRTDSAGKFFLPNVQAGELYAYARPPSDRYLAQWYPLGPSMSSVPPRTLRQGDTIEYAFTLLTSPKQPTWVSGKVVDASTGTPLAGAKVSFARKERFIHIGDTAIISNPTFLETFQVDTAVITGPDGAYRVRLLVGTDYYGFSAAAGYAMSVSPDRGNGAETNALLARSFRVQDGMTSLNFALQPSMVTTPNRIVGQVKDAQNDLVKNAVIVLINPDLQRGAGGGHTYRRYTTTITDKNGYYSFENLGYTSTYTLLAIPLDPRSVPMYYTRQGGTTVAAGSDVISALGTVQNIDFRIEPVSPGGVGTVYGRVQVLLPDNSVAPLPGTLLFAQNLVTNDVLGYAISDSTGWYSIVGLPSGYYAVTAENMTFGSATSPTIPLDYTTYNIFTASKKADILYDNRLTGTEEAAQPSSIILEQNYPNPFNPGTTIRYAVPARMNVRLRIFNAVGAEVSVPVDAIMDAGYHTIAFDGAELAGGVYFYTLEAGGTIISRSMTLLK